MIPKPNSPSGISCKDLNGLRHFLGRRSIGDEGSLRETMSLIRSNSFLSWMHNVSGGENVFGFLAGLLKLRSGTGDLETACSE